MAPRKKIEIKPIEKENARQICFSKRRQGLFKKASELSILCGATVGSVVFSASGRSFSFGHPSIDDVADRFLKSVTSDGGLASGGASHENSGALTDTVHRLNMEYFQLQQSLDSEMKKKERLQEAIEKERDERMMQWLNANVMELGLAELQEFQKWLEVVDAAVKEQTNKILVEARQITQGSVPQQPPMDIGSSSQYQFGQHISADSIVFTGPSSSNNMEIGSSSQYQFGQHISADSIVFTGPSSSYNMEIGSSSQYQFGQHISADSIVFTGPSSSNNGFIDGLEVNNPLLSGGLQDVCGLGNFPNNQNRQG